MRNLSCVYLCPPAILSVSVFSCNSVLVCRESLSRKCVVFFRNPMLVCEYGLPLGCLDASCGQMLVPKKSRFSGVLLFPQWANVEGKSLSVTFCCFRRWAVSNESLFL